MKCDKDLCLNLCCDMTKKLLWQDELTPRVRCAFGNVLFLVCGGRRRRRPLNTQSGILPAVYFCHGPSFILLPASDLQQESKRSREQQDQH